MTNLDSILKGRTITLLTKVHIVKGMVFLVVMYGCESWTIKKAECRRTDAFELWCWRRLLRVPWTARRSNQSIIKEINPVYWLKGLILKLQCFDHLMGRTNSLPNDDADAEKDWIQEEQGTIKDEMAGWYPWFSGHEFEQAPGDGKGQGSLECYIPWGHKSQFSSVAQSCPTLCDSMNHSMPGLPVHQQLPESTQTHVHQV